MIASHPHLALNSLLLFTVPPRLFESGSPIIAGFAWACTLLFFLGISAGLFSVPLEAYLQDLFNAGEAPFQIPHLIVVTHVIEYLRKEKNITKASGASITSHLSGVEKKIGT